jgi:copper chaperone CopZ
MVAETAITDLTVTASGIHCTGCESRIETVLGRVEGIRTVKADHRAQTVAVRYDPRRLDEKRVAAELASIGFPTEQPQ